MAGGGTKMKKWVCKSDKGGFADPDNLQICSERGARVVESSNHEIESNDPIRCEADSTI